MKHSWFGRFAVAAALLVFGAVGASAQVGSTTATVRGTVTGPDGAPIANAQVSVQNVASGTVKGALANANGQFIVPFVEPGGPYLVSVQSIGFGAAQREFASIGLGQIVTVNFQLTTQAVTLEGIQVNVEETPLIDVKTSGVVDRVNSVQIESLPTNGRNFADFVALAPGVQVGVGDGSGGNLALGGGNRGATNITIDGVDNNGTFFGGEARGSDRIAFAFSIETVKEFQVITNGYDVEFGNFTGGQINAITKSGTNDFQGSAFFYRRDESLLGDDFEGFAPGEFQADQFGVTVSGPIIRDKLHFLASYDEQVRSNPIFSQNAGRNDDLDPTAFAEYIDILNTVYGYDAVANNEFGQFSQTNDQRAFFGRLDWTINDKNTLTGRVNYTDLLNENDRLSSNEGRSNAGNFENRALSAVLNLKSVLGQNIFNDFRFQYSQEDRPRPGYSTLPQTEVDDFFDTSGNRSEEIEIFNDPIIAGNNLEEGLVQIVNNLQIQAGDHSFKIGTNNQFYSILNQFARNGFGVIEFDRRYGREALENFRLGAAQFYQVGIPLTNEPYGLTEYNLSEHAIYAQDTWQVNDQLTLNYGLRWDYTRLPDSPTFNQTVQTQFGVDNSGMPDDRNNFSPRVGIAYDVNGDGTSVLRAGGGLFYGRIPGVFWSNGYLNNGVSQANITCQGSFFDTPEARAQTIAIIRGEREIWGTCADIPGSPAAEIPIADVNLTSADLELPGAWKFNVGYDRQLSDNFRAGFEISHTRMNSNFYTNDLNLGAPQWFGVGGRPNFTPRADIDPTDGEPRFSSFAQPYQLTGEVGEVLQIVDLGRSRTWSATFELDRRFADNWSAGVSYAWSRARDNTSFSCCFNSTALTETPTAGNINVIGEVGDELSGSWGPADFDRTHVVTVNAVYRDAFGLPGLQLSGFYRGQSGLPFTPTVGGDANGDGRSSDRSYVGQDLQFETPEDRALMGALIDRIDCLADQEGRIATRNSCRNSWQHRIDARASFRLPTLTGQNIEFMADFFNVLNLLNSDWGQFKSAGATENLTELEGYDPVTGRQIYSVNDDFGEQLTFGFVPQQWQIQLGVRYNIN